MTDTNDGAPLIEAREISKYFGSVIALKDVSMYVNAGEVLCLLGDNGAGKSTLIKTLSGVHPPDSGTILVDGQRGPVQLAARRAPGGDRDRLPGPRDDPADEHQPELLPRIGADERPRPAARRTTARPPTG